MKKPTALATCAVLAITFAACGDDDASDDTTALTVPAGAELTTPATADASGAGDATVAPLDATVATLGGATDSAGADAAESSPASVPDGVAADCEEIAGTIGDEPPDQPEIGNEISDDFKDFIRATIDDLEALDLESDEGEAARDSFVEDLNTLADADTMTEELSNLGQSDEIAAFDALCSSALAND